MMFKRFRRLRTNQTIREMCQENHVKKSDLIYPIFVGDQKQKRLAIESMPSIDRLNTDGMLEEIEDMQKKGLKSLLLFGIPSFKDSIGSDALSDDGIIARSLRLIKQNFPDMYVITDLCFCEYTDHGHCGILDKNSRVLNDETLEISAKQALIHAQNGADMIAPSGMMDGIIQTLRSSLDENGFYDLPIMAYSSKFASAYYGPFRDIAGSSMQSGDRKTYQANGANLREAIFESLEDEKQGADILMIKPALAYLDVVAHLRQKTLSPICVYNVSGEYAMLKYAQKHKLFDYDAVLMETMTSFKRSGADLIITYHAKEVCDIMDSHA